MPHTTPSHAVALVTGAGSGIGRAVATALAREGYAVALVGRRGDALRETLTLLEKQRGMTIPADLASPGEARRCVRATLAAWGRLDLLVCNAGMGKVVPIAETTEALLRETFELNTMAPASMVLEAWPTFQAQHAAGGRGGCVVHISSMASIDPFPGFYAYAASKGAVNLLAASTAKEGTSIGVRAFAIAPGAVETPMLRAAFDETALPREQCLAPEDVARVVLACARGDRDRDNGRTIPVLPASAKGWFREWLGSHPPLEE